MRKNLCEKCCVGTVIYSDKCGKTAVRETMDAEINYVIYMELYSGGKMTDGKYQKTYIAGSIEHCTTQHFESTLLSSSGETKNLRNSKQSREPKRTIHMYDRN
jgi:hypothetical protein